MIDFIISYIETLSRGNEVVAGALALAVSGTVGTVVVYMLKELPKKLGKFLWQQMVTSIVLNNSDWNKNITFIKMSNYIRKNSNRHLTRNLMLDSYYDEGEDCACLSVTVGYGLHIFFYKGKLMWVHKTKEESSGSEIQKEQLTIYTFGRKHEKFDQLVKDLSPKKDKDKVEIYEYGEGKWQLTSKNS